MSYFKDQYRMGADTFRKHPITFMFAMLVAASIGAACVVVNLNPALDFSSPQEKAQKAELKREAEAQLRAWIDRGVIQKAERNSVWIKRRQWDAYSADDKYLVINVAHLCGYDFVRDWSNDKILGKGCFGNLKIE